MQSLISKDGRIDVLKDIVVPKKFYNRIDLGVPVLNELFGGQDMPGILPGCSFLFTGTPGAGKSTFALQLADLMTKNAGRNVLYNIGEENRYMVKMRSDRLRLSGTFCVSHHEQVDDLIQFCDDAGVEVLIQDSLQSLRCGDISGPKLLKVVTKRLQAWKERSDVTIVIIGHSTKGGQFAGPNEIKHDVDAHIHLKIDPESGNRILELEKNRFGPSSIPYQLSMSSSGLDFQQVTVTTDDGDTVESGTSRSADRRTTVVQLIKERMLAGEAISGYCFDRLQVECSGGFWRGMWARAQRELKNEGHSIIEKTIEGRLHTVLEGR